MSDVKNIKRLILQYKKNDVTDICIHLLNLVYSTNSNSKIDFIYNYLRKFEKDFYEKF